MDKAVVGMGNVGLGGRHWHLKLDFTFQSCMTSGPSYFTSLCLAFIACKMEMIITLASRVSLPEDKMSYLCLYYTAGEAPGVGVSAFSQPGEVLSL